MLLQMGVSIVILRLLTPEQMGIMAIPVVFSSLALVMVDSGFSQTLIRKAVPSEEDYKSVFVFNIAVSVLLYLLLVGAMPWIARFYGMPELVRIAPVLFLLVPLNALCVIQNTIFTRQFRFARLSKVVFTSSLVSGLVAIGMAWAGCGIWSLVGQRVVAMGVRAMLLWGLSDWRPRAAFDAGRLRAMAPYSFRLLATDLISSVYNNVSQLFVGKLYAADVLGFFNQAQKLKELPVTSTMQAVQSVTFPAVPSGGRAPGCPALPQQSKCHPEATTPFPALNRRRRCPAFRRSAYRRRRPRAVHSVRRSGRTPACEARRGRFVFHEPQNRENRGTRERRAAAF